MRQINILAVVAAALACAVAHAGDVYKYVDERGNTMYTDKPIPGAVLVKTTTPRPAESTQRATATAQANDANRLAASNQRIADNQANARAAANVARDLEASRVERCKQAREQYQQSLTNRRLYREKPDGQKEYLNEAELAQARVDSYKNVEAICGPQG
jgi:hypothetical protein